LSTVTVCAVPPVASFRSARVAGGKVTPGFRYGVTVHDGGATPPAPPSKSPFTQIGLEVDPSCS
jgi:hypothetical protein